MQNTFPQTVLEPFAYIRSLKTQRSYEEPRYPSSAGSQLTKALVSPPRLENCYCLFTAPLARSPKTRESTVVHALDTMPFIVVKEHGANVEPTKQRKRALVCRTHIQYMKSCTSREYKGTPQGRLILAATGVVAFSSCRGEKTTMWDWLILVARQIVYQRCAEGNYGDRRNDIHTYIDEILLDALVLHETMLARLPAVIHPTVEEAQLMIPRCASNEHVSPPNMKEGEAPSAHLAGFVCACLSCTTQTIENTTHNNGDWGNRVVGCRTLFCPFVPYARSAMHPTFRFSPKESEVMHAQVGVAPGQRSGGARCCGGRSLLLLMAHETRSGGVPVGEAIRGKKGDVLASQCIAGYPTTRISKQADTRHKTPSSLFVYTLHSSTFEASAFGHEHEEQPIIRPP